MFWCCQGWVRSHAAIGVALAEVSGSVDFVASTNGGRKGGLFDGLWMKVLGDGDLAGGGVGAFLVTVEFVGQGVNGAAHEPVADAALDLRCQGNVQVCQGGIAFGKGGFEGGDVAAVAVDEEVFGKSGTREGNEIVSDNLDQGAGTQADAARKGGVVEGHANIDWRTDHCLGSFADPLRDRIRANGISSDQASGSVLLSGTDR